MNLHSPGWLKRYLVYRTRYLYPFWYTRTKVREEFDSRFFSDDYSTLDDLFYNDIRQSGLHFGCQLLTPELVDEREALKYLTEKDQITFINLELLFGSLMRELSVLAPNLNFYEIFLARALIRIVQFYQGSEIDTRYFSLDISELLADRTFSKKIRKVEQKFKERIKPIKLLNLTSTLQNSLAFLDIYGLITWNRLFHKQKVAPIYFLPQIEKNHIKLQKQLILVFAGLLWQPLSHKEELPPSKKKMLKRYIDNTRLPSREKHKIYKDIKEPVDLHNIHYHISDAIINRFMLEQSILLSMIDEELSPTHISFIHELGRNLGVSDRQLQESLSSVADFFDQHSHRFDFIKGNLGFHYIRGRISSQIALTVGKNRERILKEIKRTGRLYQLLSGSGHQSFTKEEKLFIKSQLLSVAKTIPALAIFCLPAGALVLSVITKVLPFNLLPNAFLE